MKKRIYFAIIAIFIVSGMAMAQEDPFENLQTDLLKATVCCEVFPASQSIFIDSTLELSKTVVGKTVLLARGTLSDVKVLAGTGEALPYVVATGVIIIESLPAGTQTVSVSYMACFKGQATPTMFPVINEDFMQFDDSQPCYPVSFFMDWHDVKMAVTAPKGFEIAGPGIPLGKKVSRGKVTSYFRSEGPVCRGAGLFGGKYRIYSDLIEGITLEIFVRRNMDFPAWHSWADYMKKTLGFYRARYGFYPFSRLRIVQLPNFHDLNGRGGGQTFVMIGGDSSFTMGPSEHRSPNFVAHETFHQFFGALIFPNVLKGGINIIEGTTQYASLICAESFVPGTIEKMGRRFLAEVRKIPPDQDVEIMKATLENPSASTLAYDKFPLFLLELRKAVGDETMIRIERGCLEKYRFGKFLSLADFVQVIHAETKGNPTAASLCTDWLEKKGIPPITVFEESAPVNRDFPLRMVVSADRSNRECFEQTVEDYRNMIENLSITR